MTASPTDGAGRGLLPGIVLAGLLLLVGTSFGCAKRPPPLGEQILLPLRHRVAWLPAASDQAAARAAGAALTNNRRALHDAVSEIHAASPDTKGEDLDALSRDLLNSTLDDARAYRKASKALTNGFGTDPALQARLDQVIADDPLALAWRRRRDTWEKYWARTFNAVSQPLGQALFSGFILAPMTIATSSAHFLASFSNDEPLSITDRQALVLRREYLARNPDADDADKVREQIEGAEKKLAKTMQKRRLRDARAAQASGNDRLAIIEAERTLYWGPNESAEQIRSDAQVHIEAIRSLQEASLRAPAVLSPADASIHALAVELLNTSSTAAALSEETLRALRPRSQERQSDEALYVFAMAQREAGYEDESWQTLMTLATRDSDDSAMSRHAVHSFYDPWQNSYKAYRDMRARKRNDEIRWRLFANYANGTRYPNLPKPLAYTLEAPGVATALLTSPIRMIFGRWKKGPDFHRSSAVLGYRYLGINPDGTHSREVMQWLYEYERQRGNYPDALRLADFLPGIDPRERAELAEAASAQALESADRIGRSDRRNQVLRHASTEYPDTESGSIAGKRIRWELERASPQEISVTKSFLQENPRVAGENGLGINPDLINDEMEDGELHPMGVTFLGGRDLRFYLMPESGEEKDEPDTVIKTVSNERISRLASMLDETVRRNQLIDVDDTLAPDGDRDRFLERARLGLVDRVDRRPTARSTYVYKSMRERYGIVRGRESVLPFDLVFRGSFTDLQLGAFPRWRPPKETPDAFLYR